MASSSRVEIEKFNGKRFELWKLKMEYLLVDKEQWAAVDPGTKPTAVSTEDWEKLDRKATSTIRLSLRLSTTECFWRRLCEKFMGKVRELISVYVPGK